MSENLNHLIQQHLQHLNAEYIDILDESHKHAGHRQNTGGKHLHLTIVSTSFIGKNRLERQRIINKALKPLFHTHIHALSISAKIPNEVKNLSYNTPLTNLN